MSPRAGARAVVLMRIKPDKVQGVAWAFGSLTGDKRLWADDAAENPADRERTYCFQAVR